jgi:hypothetical protein
LQQQKYHFSSTRTSSISSTALSMALIRLPVDELEQLISSTSKPTPQQYQSYYGRTDKERYSRIVEASIVALLGCSVSYFLSFVLGGFVATILGFLSLIWGILSPELKAYQRNWEFLAGRQLIDSTFYEDHSGLYGALLIGHIADVCVVPDATAVDEEYDLMEFQDYTMDTDELDQYTGQSYLLRLFVQDSNIKAPRELQIHAHMSEEYLGLQQGLPVCVLLLSQDDDFSTLTALTDVYVYNPAGGDAVLVGDYPFFHRDGLEQLLATNDYVWNTLLQEAQEQQEKSSEEDDDYYDIKSGMDEDDPYLYNSLN